MATGASQLSVAGVLSACFVPFACDTARAPRPPRSPLAPRSAPRPRPRTSRPPRPRPRMLESVVAAAAFGFFSFLCTSPHCEIEPVTISFLALTHCQLHEPEVIPSMAAISSPLVSCRAKTRSSSLQPSQTSRIIGNLSAYFDLSSPSWPCSSTGGTFSCSSLDVCDFPPRDPRNPPLPPRKPPRPRGAEPLVATSDMFCV